jgi:methylmalonyl-CoA mutase cobalamin-binding subunit
MDSNVREFAKTNSKGSIIIGATESDPHVVSLFLARVYLEEEGYDVIYRGCQSSVDELITDVDRDLDLICYIFVNQNGHAVSDLRNLRKRKDELAVSVPICLAGHYTVPTACIDEVRKSLRHAGIDLFIESFEELISTIEQICSDVETLTVTRALDVEFVENYA